MKVLISRNIPDTTAVRLVEEGFDVITAEKGKIWTSEELINACQNVDFLLHRGGTVLDANFFLHCSHLKGVALTSVGYNHVDVAAATKACIPVSNTPDVLSDATADIALLLMLTVSRKAFFRANQVLRGEWKGSGATEDLGVELYRKTLGIFGLGRIGLALARRAKVIYGMEIIYYNRHRNVEAEREVDAVYVSFDELLERSDVISIHTNLSPETEDRFNAAAFRKMKKSAIFINTARGKIHNEVDLTEALASGDIWGAGLDVTNPEPMLPDNPLLNMPNVCVLPHIGSATMETRTKMAVMAANNLVAAKNGKRMPQVVNAEVYKMK
ncbi:2-hydroxyacid dehydrogenase [Sphingobacterium sp. SGR-19]|uniref:2-hydroxyacid dehydrogenase n=1 Tax=Sphingobacterium sp. SGR-19 TaxID=2710886 RepID=UPI0013EB7051|nr:D-glycerate dehydrogenase [Sphingobacterium sp. SGR-19]NGM64354.1 D-glycerate dehydrogenase [Sphingobacterium sp. SGR-19]